MSITLDYINLIVISDESLNDMVDLHIVLREIESSTIGMLYPIIHQYKEAQIGGGAVFPIVKFINGWTLQFVKGYFSISGGNLDATVNPVHDCYVERIQSAAYAVTSIGSTGLSQDDINAIGNKVLQKILESKEETYLLPEERSKLMSIPSVSEISDAILDSNI